MDPLLNNKPGGGDLNPRLFSAWMDRAHLRVSAMVTSKVIAQHNQAYLLTAMYGIVPSVNHKETWNQWGICYIKQLNAVIHLRNDLTECVWECVGISIDYDVQEGSVGWPPQDLGLCCYVPTTALKSIQLLISGDYQCWCSCSLLWINLKIQFACTEKCPYIRKRKRFKFVCALLKMKVAALA